MQRYWILGIQSLWPNILYNARKKLRIYCGSTAGPYRILRIYCGPVWSRGSSSGCTLDLADPLFHRCLFADLLRIYCEPVGSCGSTVLHVFADLLRPVGPHGSTARQCGPIEYLADLYCRPVRSCGSTAGQLDLADPLFYMYLRICWELYIHI